MFLSVHPFFVVYRPPSNQIAFATQSDCVRCMMIYLDV